EQHELEDPEHPVAGEVPGQDRGGVHRRREVQVRGPGVGQAHGDRRERQAAEGEDPERQDLAARVAAVGATPRPAAGVGSGTERRLSEYDGTVAMLVAITFASAATIPNTARATMMTVKLITVVTTETLAQRVSRPNKLWRLGVVGAVGGPAGGSTASAVTGSG